MEVADRQSGPNINDLLSSRRLHTLGSSAIKILMSSQISIFISNNVLLLGKDQPKPATIVVDNNTGKIVEVKESRATREEYPDVTDEHWIDAGDKMILPGLVEYVEISLR